MKLSVIVPCYNVEKYVKDCVLSLVKAQIDDMEIILVNDGSKDNTLNILKELKKEYTGLVKVVDKENGGLSSARNAGIVAAKGEYICFVDSDDSVEKDMFKVMMKKALSNDFDVVCCGENRIFDDHVQLVDPGFNKDAVTQDEVKDIMPFIYPAACNKMYKKELFNNILFTEGIWYEDVEFIYRLLPTINKIGCVEGHYYNYYQREGSITYTYSRKLYDFVNNLNSLVEYYKDNNIFDEYKDVIEYTYVRYLYATFIKRLAKCKDKNEFKIGVNVVLDNVKDKFPKYRKNKYLKGAKGLYLKYFNRFIANIIFIMEKDKKN